MSKFIQGLFQLVMLACLVLGGFIVYKSQFEQKKTTSAQKKETGGPKAQAIRDYLGKYKKPARVEISNHTDRFYAEVEEIKQMKIAQDPESDVYVTIQFFTDETDSGAPLVAQFRFIGLKTGNTVHEESINLDQ